MAKKRERELYIVVDTTRFEYIVEIYTSINALARRYGCSARQIQRLIKEHKKYKNRFFEKIF